VTLPGDVTRPAYGAVVVGSGVVGLAAAWHLLGLGCRPLAVVERFRIGHDRGGSHGSVRMTRSAYASPVYAGLMRHVREQEWPRLERAAGLTLVHPRDVLFFGPDRAALGAYATAVQAAGADVGSIPVPEARRRFPSLRFTDDMEILLDRTGGSVAADGTIRALRRLVTAAGGVVLEDTRVVALEGGASTVRVVADRGVLRAERVVVAAGAWLRQLVPAAARAVTAVPQTVAYFRLGVPASTIPSYVRFDGPDAIAYGLPEIGRDALKVGRHVTKGPGVDPDEVGPPSPGEVETLRDDLEQILAVPIRELVGAERCLYTVTPTEDFVIDRWSDDSRVVFAAACSGHGFKFAPLTGRIVAELAVHGRADLPDGLDAGSLFGLGRPARAGLDG
jgi:sarcosine oxidase